MLQTLSTKGGLEEAVLSGVPRRHIGKRVLMSRDKHCRISKRGYISFVPDISGTKMGAWFYFDFELKINQTTSSAATPPSSCCPPFIRPAHSPWSVDIWNAD